MNENILKLCSKCKKEKDKSLFYKDKYAEDGYASLCKECRDKYNKNYVLNNQERVCNNRSAFRKRRPDLVRKYNLKFSYGLTLDQYEELHKSQNGLCWICGISEDSGEKFQRLCVDHCHKTGVVRGLLCSNCNYGLGKFKDSPDLLVKAIEYLSRYE